jgi:DNA polymerase I
VLITPNMVEPAIRAIAAAPRRTFDFETTGLRPFGGDRIIGVSVEAGMRSWYFPVAHTTGANISDDALDAVLTAILVPSGEVAGHNASRFDAMFVARRSNLWHQRMLAPGGRVIRDTIVDQLLVDENSPSFSLDALGQRYLGEDAQKRGAKQAVLDYLRKQYPRLGDKALMGKLAEAPPSLIAPYAEADVLDCRRLCALYDKHHADWGLTALAEEMYAFSRLLAAIEARGMLVDQDLCHARIAGLEADKAAALARLDEIAPGLNPRSAPQVKKLLGTKNAQGKTLKRCGHEAADLIIEANRCGKFAATFYQGMLSKLDDAGVLHTVLKMTRDPKDEGGTRTGRLSSAEPNLQNLPKRNPEERFRVRDALIARPGMVFVAGDYERAEMWVGAHYSGDPSLYDAYASGRDLYKELAETSGIERQGAKMLWLMTQYGAGVWKIADSLGWPEDTAYASKQAFFKLCPGIKRRMYALSDEAEYTGALRLWTGRVRHFDGVKSKAFAAWNAVVQGGVGEMVRIAMQRLEAPLAAEGASLVLQVHDELVAEVPVEAAPRVISLMQHHMTDFPHWKLRPRVEFSTGTRYGQVEKYAGK